MLTEISAEEKAARIERQRQTAARNRAARAEKQRQQAAEIEAREVDTERARTICRMIRDNESAYDRDRLEAIKILLSLNEA